MTVDVKSEIKNIDWKFFLKRKNAIYYLMIFNKTNDSLQRKETGVGSTHELFLHKNEMAWTFNSKKETKEIRDNYLKLVKENSPKLKQWKNLGLKWIKRKKELISLTDEVKNMKDIEYDKYLNVFHQICLYGTVIPHTILLTINHAVENGKSKKQFENVIKLFEPFRAESLNILHHTFMKEIWAYAGRILDVNHKDASLLTPEEMGKLFKGEDYPFLEKIKKRKKGCILYVSNEKPTFLYDISPEELNLESVSFKGEEAKGLSIFKGLVKGTVKIINAPDDMHKLKEGDIAVSINCTPQITPVLAKAAAIVTDEGGIGSHAAIVARELKKPCIIATKIASSIFKDGDYVEVDANKGVVRKIK